MRKTSYEGVSPIDNLYSIPEAAQILKLSKFTVRLWINRGYIPVVQLGRRIMIHPDDLQAFIQARRTRRGPAEMGRLGVDPGMAKSRR